MRGAREKMNGEESLAKKYRSIKNRLFFFSLIFNILLLLILFFSQASLYLRQQSEVLFKNAFLINGFYILIFCLFFYFLNFPLELFEGFILEHKFKLSTQNFLNWLKDEFKKGALNFVILFIVIEAMYFFLNKFTQTWWIWLASFWVFLTVILAKITPAVIIPLFYKYLPIKDELLKQRIFSLFDKCNLKIKDVTSINFSAKTKKANAFVAGLGKNKRFALSDTLLENFSSGEIEAVVAHELGHYLSHDILKLILVNSLFTFLGFFLVDRLLKNLAIADIAFFPLLALSLTFLGFIILPVINGFSRFLETKADLFSLNLTKDKPSFISAMEKLGKINLADLSPNRFIEIWLYDHPAIARRIKLAKDFKFDV